MLFSKKKSIRCGVVGNISVSHMLASGSIPGIGIFLFSISFLFVCLFFFSVFLID